MKIDRFNIPNYDSPGETKNIKSDQVASNKFQAIVESPDLKDLSGKKLSPLQSGLVSIAKSTDFNSPAASNSAIEKAARLIVGNVIGSGLASKLDQEKMMNAITSFVENDPVVGQKLRGLLERLA